MWTPYKSKLKQQIEQIENILKKEKTQDMIDLGVCVLSTFQLLNQIELIDNPTKQSSFWDEIKNEVITTTELIDTFLADLNLQHPKARE